MNRQTLAAVVKIRRLNQTDLAKMAGVSRQAVSSMLKTADQEKGEIQLRSRHLLNLALGLGVPVELLAKPLPLADNPALMESLQTDLLWDRLYPDLIAFADALLCWQADALARLVQVYGLFAAERMLGKDMWRRFPEYRSKIHPARRTGLEILWKSQQALGLI